MSLKEIYTKDETLFFDSYAFFEILKGNLNYEPYKNCRIITTKLNIFELYFGLLRDVDEQSAEKYLDKYYPFVLDFDKDIIIEAAKMRLRLRNRNISMTDCIGYILSLKLKIKFLTGDKEFENFKNVEFVK